MINIYEFGSNINNIYPTNDLRFIIYLDSDSDEYFLFNTEIYESHNMSDCIEFEINNLSSNKELALWNNSFIYILDSKILSVLNCVRKHNGMTFLNICHYDILNNFDLIKKITLDLSICTKNCTNHNDSCKDSNNNFLNSEDIYLIQLKKDYEYLIGGKNNNLKSPKSFILNIKTLNVKIFDNYYIEYNFLNINFDHILFLSPENKLLLYNNETLQENKYECEINSIKIKDLYVEDKLYYKCITFLISDYNYKSIFIKNSGMIWCNITK